MSLEVRGAEAGDASAIALLLGELGYSSSAEEVGRRLEAYSGVGGTHVIVAEEGDEVIGLGAMQVMPLVHRDLSVGRITAMVVRSDRRGSGVGGGCWRSWRRSRGAPGAGGSISPAGTGARRRMASTDPRASRTPRCGS